MAPSTMQPTTAKTVDPRMAQWASGVLVASPVARALGIAMTVFEVDRVVMALPFSAGNITVGSVVHGGVIATLIDVAGAAASASGANGDEVRGGATANLTIHYLAPADGCDLEAEAVVVRRTRRQTLSDITVRAGSTVVAKALLTSAIFVAER